MIETVGLETIDYTRSRDANPRQGIDDDAVRRYADRMNAGDVFPPAVLYRVGGALLVADGLHRIAAAMAAGRDTIEAEVVDGDEVAWKEAILTSNQDHGLPWSRTERRQVVAEWLGIHPERADNWIAELAQVSKNTVAKVRQELEATCQIDRLTELMGKDGKMRPRTLAPSASGQEFEFEWVPRGWSPPPGASEGSLNAMRAQFERLHEETIGDEHYPGGEPYMADALGPWGCTVTWGTGPAHNCRTRWSRNTEIAWHRAMGPSRRLSLPRAARSSTGRCGGLHRAKTSGRKWWWCRGSMRRIDSCYRVR